MVMLPPLLMMLAPVVMAAPEFMEIAPAPLPSESLLSTTFSLLDVELIDLPAATEMLLWALRVNVASPPLILLMFSFTAMLPAPKLSPVVCKITLVPSFKLAAMSDANMVDEVLGP